MVEWCIKILVIKLMFYCKCYIDKKVLLKYYYKIWILIVIYIVSILMVIKVNDNGCN